MKWIVLSLILVSLLWLQSCNGIKCYVQQCNKDDKGWECDDYNEGGVGEYENRVCKEERVITENGTVIVYRRTEGYADKDEMESLKNGKETCFTYKGEFGKIHACLCDKDLCNKNWKLPENVRYWKDEDKDQTR